MNIDKLKKIIVNWASKLPYRVNIYLFGSWVKGTVKNDSDLDIAIEFIDQMSNLDRDFLWFDFHDKWQNYLTKEIGLPIQLELYEGDRSPHLKKYLKEASILLYSSKEH